MFFSFNLTKKTDKHGLIEAYYFIYRRGYIYVMFQSFGVIYFKKTKDPLDKSISLETRLSLTGKHKPNTNAKLHEEYVLGCSLEWFDWGIKERLSIDIYGEDRYQGRYNRLTHQIIRKLWCRINPLRIPNERRITHRSNQELIWIRDIRKIKLRIRRWVFEMSKWNEIN